MVRFRPKTDFVSFAREQIRGGLWYRPGWWEAVSRVPPAHFTPRIPKKEIPIISLAEDSLLKKFNARNASIAAFDKPKSTKGGSSRGPSGAAKTVGSLFVEKQLEAMKEGEGKVTEEQAYAIARAWMLENGKSLFARLNVPVDVRAALAATDPEKLYETKNAVETELKKQLDEVRRALRKSQQSAAASISAASSGATLLTDKVAAAAAKYKSLRTPAEDSKFSLRAWSREPHLPRAGSAYESEDEESSTVASKLVVPSSTSLSKTEGDSKEIEQSKLGNGKQQNINVGGKGGGKLR
jgi:hypothetical protein